MAHLHNHSTFSIIDGRGTIEDYLKLAKADKQEAFAITDHGTMAGAIDLYKAAKRLEIKPVVGMELYVDVSELREKPYPGHLTVLAKNEAGYRALIAANNLAHRQFYYRPRVSIRQILDMGLNRDWIILSGCMSSPIYEYPQSESEQIVKQLAATSSGFFLEFMWHPGNDQEFQAKQQLYLERVVALHKSTGIPMVITNDCHYAHPHQESIHKEIQAASQEKDQLEFDGDCFHFRTSAEMESICRSLGYNNGWDNAVCIGKGIDLYIPEADNISWYVPDITGGTPEETLRNLCLKKLWDIQNYSPHAKEYFERYEHELSVLRTSPAILNSYLVTHDLVDWCRRRGIPAAARGSMAGSLVSWLLGITLEDPVKYRLSFSRAVNPARPTIPDFDLDVSSIHRADILDYLKTRYDNNIPIAAYTHYGPKGALRKVLRMEGTLDFPSINELAKPLPDDWADGDFEYSPTAKKFIGKDPWFEKVPEAYRDKIAIYQGLYSTASVHPSGILVGGPERELEHEVPLQWVASSKTLVSAFDMYTLKKLGLFKLDVLGLRTLDALAYMEKESGAHVPDDNYDDPVVLQSFGEDRLAEIFQMDGYACQNVLEHIKPIVDFEDLVAANTLARPGCAQFLPYYRSGYEGLTNEYPQLAEILGVTNGLILYQEQVMEIARVLADFDDAEQDDVKESIKYFRHDNWNHNIAPKFNERCRAKGIDAKHILEAIARMASYTYNRAHALTYAAIAYKMMWYKVYHPAAYYAAVFDGCDDKPRLVLESQAFGVRWRPADVNLSQSETIVHDNEIILGLSAIKGVGPKAFEALAVARPFTSIDDLQNRVERRKCNSRVIARLQEAYALDSIGSKGTASAFEEAFGFPRQLLNPDMFQSLAGYQSDFNHVVGFLLNLHETVIKKQDSRLKGRQMATLSMVNAKGRQKCIIFPDVWDKAKGKIRAGQNLVLEGEYQLSGDFIVQRGAQL